MDRLVGSRSAVGSEFRRVALSPLDRDFIPALALTLPDGSDRSQRAVSAFVRRQKGRGIDLSEVHAAYHKNTLLSAVSVLKTPGRSAMLLAPIHPSAQLDPSDWARLTGLLLQDALRSAHDVAVFELLIPPESTPLQEAALKAGLRRITRLQYMDCDCLLREMRLPPAPAGLEALAWSSSRVHLFEEALLASYAQSMDCPELASVRSAAEILAGHRTTGEFDPSLWRVGIRDGRPVGIILVSRLEPRATYEVVYLGVAQSARRQGVASALLLGAMRSIQLRGATSLALAVDERNVAARCFYARFGFRPRAVREAWAQVSMRQELGENPPPGDNPNGGSRIKIS